MEMICYRRGHCTHHLLVGVRIIHGRLVFVCGSVHIFVRRRSGHARRRRPVAVVFVRTLAQVWACEPRHLKLSLMYSTDGLCRPVLIAINETVLAPRGVFLPLQSSLEKTSIQETFM
jgi:hypothetical protein